jgi:hypothetical protein
VTLYSGGPFDPSAWRAAWQTGSELAEELRGGAQRLKEFAVVAWRFGVKWGTVALTIAGAASTLYGADTVARDFARQTDASVLDITSVFVMATAAGLVDDAIMATGIGAPLVMDSWEHRGAGPSQRLVGDLNIDLSTWWSGSKKEGQ